MFNVYDGAVKTCITYPEDLSYGDTDEALGTYEGGVKRYAALVDPTSEAGYGPTIRAGGSTWQLAKGRINNAVFFSQDYSAPNYIVNRVVVDYLGNIGSIVPVAGISDPTIIRNISAKRMPNGKYALGVLIGSASRAFVYILNKDFSMYTSIDTGIDVGSISYVIDMNVLSNSKFIIRVQSTTLTSRFFPIDIDGTVGAAVVSATGKQNEGYFRDGKLYGFDFNSASIYLNRRSNDASLDFDTSLGINPGADGGAFAFLPDGNIVFAYHPVVSGYSRVAVRKVDTSASLIGSAVTLPKEANYTNRVTSIHAFRNGNILVLYYGQISGGDYSARAVILDSDLNVLYNVQTNPTKLGDNDFVLFLSSSVFFIWRFVYDAVLGGLWYLSIYDDTLTKLSETQVAPPSIYFGSITAAVPGYESYEAL